MTFEHRFKDLLLKWLREKRGVNAFAVLKYHDGCTAGGYYADEVEHYVDIEYSDGNGHIRYFEAELRFPDLINELSELDQ